MASASGNGSTARAEGAARTRTALIEAGLRLAEETGLEALTADVVVGEAGVSKGTFFHHFGDRPSYLIALHRHFHDALRDEVLAADPDAAPGRDRVVAMSTAYLNSCLRHRGVKALLLEARGSAILGDEIVRRNAESASLLRPDFVALGRQYPTESARLWVALVAECALVELERGSRNQRARRALFRFLD